MRSLTLVFLLLLVAGCGTTSPSASASASAVLHSPTATPDQSGDAPASVKPSVVPSPSSSSSSSPSVDPARPYDAAAILDAMKHSRRPGGVPDQVETQAIAKAIASRVWTYDGSPWQSVAAGGSCGSERCTLDVAGTPPDAAGEDLYTFSITPASGEVELLVADLHGYPAALGPELDGIARAGLDPDRLEGLAMLAARWLAPPDTGHFVLSYRSGGEEGSDALDVVIDLPSHTVLEVRRPAQ